MFALSQTKRVGKYNPLRNECRIYYCEKCKAYHLTSKKDFVPISFEEATGMSIDEFNEIENIL